MTIYPSFYVQCWGHRQYLLVVGLDTGPQVKSREISVAPIPFNDFYIIAFKTKSRGETDCTSHHWSVGSMNFLGSLVAIVAFESRLCELVGSVPHRSLQLQLSRTGHFAHRKTGIVF